MTAATQEGLRIIESLTCLSSAMQSPMDGPWSSGVQSSERVNWRVRDRHEFRTLDPCRIGDLR
jgi:hypothetical protein